MLHNIKLILIAVVLAGCASYQYAGTLLVDPRPLGDFTLTDVNGNPYSLSQSDAELTVFYFGFTYCPDICPTTLFEVGRAWEGLGDRADDVQFVMITIDPERDSAEQLHNYVTNFDESFLGVRTDDADLLAEVASRFGVAYELGQPAEGSPLDYDVAHTSSLFVVNAEGELIAIMSHETPADAITADLRAHLRAQ